MRKLCCLVSLILPLMASGQSMEEFLTAAAGHGFRGSVLVAKEEKVLLEKGYGLADAEANRPQTAATVFSVGSITKQFTGAAIMKLSEEGILSTGDALGKFFPDAPADKRAITLHQLLTHSSGFPPGIGDDYEKITGDEFMQRAFNTPLDSKPGERYEYSNVGYSILGIIVEKVSGMGYEQYLHEKLFKPAGMNHTGYLIPDFAKNTLAIGYRNGVRWGSALDQQWMNDGPGWHLRANGGILSTVGDMYKWYQALRDNKVLGKASMEQLLGKHVAEDEAGTSYYGYGWVQQSFGGINFSWHNGGNRVYSAFMAFAPDEDICIIVSSNTNNIISDRVAIQLFNILRGKPAEALPQSILRPEAPYRTNPVTQKIFNGITEKGGSYFGENYQRLLTEAGFDFENDMLLLGVGEKLIEANKLQDAVQLFIVYTKLFPNIVVAWNQLGRTYKALNEIEKAKACFRKSIELRPNDNPAVYLLEELK